MPTSPSHWTLRAKLLASVLALFTVVMLATSALTVLQTRNYLTTQLATDLQGASSRALDPRRGGFDPDGDGRVAPPRGGPNSTPGGGSALYLVLMPDGSVATNASGEEYNAVINDSAADDTLDTAQVREVSEAATSSDPTRVQVGGDVGDYLISTHIFADGTREIVGVSTAPVDEMQAQLLGVVVGGTAIGLVLVGVGGTVLIRRSLAPLDRVAATARRVSSLKLDSGQVALAERVPAADADGHTEVGQVGLAINTMLDNVESALHARQESETQVRQFVADASHELRTPLASIRGYAELTRRETEPVPPTRHPRHRPGGVRGAAHAGARRGPAAARPARLRPPARARAGRPVAARGQRRERRPRRRARPHLGARPARGPRRGARRPGPAAPDPGQPARQRAHPHPGRHARRHPGATGGVASCGSR